MELLTTKQVANILNVHEQTIKAWIKEKKIKSVKIGKIRRIEREEVERLVKGGE